MPAAIERLARPRASEIAPLGQIERGAAQPLHRTVFVHVAGTDAAARPPQRSPHAFGRRLENRLEPGVEGLVEQALGLAFGQHAEQRIDPRFDRTLAQQVGAEPVDGADVRLFEVLHGLVQPRRRRRATRRLLPLVSSRCRRRSFNSPAAFSVNVTATISRTLARPSASTRTIRFTSSVVLPVPAAASTTSVSSSASRMSRRASSSVSCAAVASWPAPQRQRDRRADPVACAGRG